MSNDFGRGRPPRPDVAFGSQSASQNPTQRPARRGIKSTSDIGPTLTVSLTALLLVIVSAFLPWSYPIPDQNWLERLFSLDVEAGPRLSGIDVGFGQSAAFTAGVAILIILVVAVTGVFPRTLTSVAMFFSLFAAYHVLNGFREVARGELWWLEDGDLKSQPASEATWSTLVAMTQNGYGLLIGAITVLVAGGAIAELVAMASGAGSLVNAEFNDSEWVRLLLKVSVAFVLGFIWVGTWWWATFIFAVISAGVWLASGRRFDDLSLRAAIVPMVSLGGLLSAMHAFFYR